MVRPGGKEEFAAENVSGRVPPVVLIAALYGAPTIPLGSTLVVMKRVSTAMVSVCVAFCTGVDESFTLTVNVKEPAELGVPLSTPVLLNTKPGGKEPLVTLAV